MGLRSEITLSLLASLFLVMCSGAAVTHDDELPEINLPGFFLPNANDLLDSGDDPKPCCLPSKWQGDVTSQVGWGSRRRRGEDRSGREGGFRQQSMTVYVDGDNKKLAGTGKCCNDTCGFLVIFQSNSSADFYNYKVGSKKCFHKKADHAVFRKQCIPDNSTFQGSVKVGPASGGLGVDVWKFRGGSHHRDAAKLQILVAGRVLVTSGSCLPVIFQDHGLFRSRRGEENSEGTQFQMEDDMELMDQVDDTKPGPHPRPGGRGGAFMGSAFYSNVEQSIKDPAVFNIPDYCKSISGDLKFDDDLEYPDIVDRFVVLK